mmetsp:Transcript_73478/g.215531  ORF Transcript_73478/g.215531 Transcript_73478/m.215531 type:complete len:591 (+) Transcript_73478:358-2130(+)
MPRARGPRRISHLGGGESAQVPVHQGVLALALAVRSVLPCAASLGPSRVGVHRHEGGVLGHEGVLQAEGRDLALRVAAQMPQLRVVREHRDAGARPEQPDRGHLGHLHLGEVLGVLPGGAARQLPPQADPPGELAVPLADDLDRPAGEDVRQVRRLLRPGPEGALEGQAEARQDRRVDVALQLLHHRRALLLAGDDEGLSVANTCEPLNKVAVHAVADPEDEYVAISKVVAHQVKGLALHRHISVGHDHDGSGNRCIEAGEAESPPQRGEQFCASSSIHVLVKPRLSLINVFLRGLHVSSLAEDCGASSEEHDVEAVPRAHVLSQELPHQAFGEINRVACHGARRVQNEEVLPLRDLLGVQQLPLGRLDGQGEVLLRAVSADEELGADGPLGEPEAHDHVRVRPRERGPGGPRGVGHRHRQRGLDAQARRLQREAHVGAEVRGVRAGRPALPVARAHDRREGEGEDAVDGRQGLDVLHGDLHGVARQDVGELHGEDVGPLLVEQAGGLPGVSRGLELGPGLAARADLAGHRAVVDGHRHGADGSASGQREDVARLEAVLTVVLVGLGHSHVRNAIVHLCINGRPPQWEVQ